MVGGLGEDRPVRIVEVDRGVVGQQLLVALPVSVHGADVAPVALEAVLAGIALVDQPRKRVVADVLEPLVAGRLGELVERVEQRSGTEGEDLVADHVPGRLVGLVDVLAHAPPGGLHDAVAAGVVGIDLGGDHGHHRAALGVLFGERAVVELVDRIGAGYQEHLGSELADDPRAAPQRVGRALREPAAIVVPLPRVQQHQPAGRAVEVPRAPVGHVVAQRHGVVLLGHPHVGEPGVLAVAEREVDQPVRAGEGHRGLGAPLRQQLEAAAGAPGEDDDERADP